MSSYTCVTFFEFNYNKLPIKQKEKKINHVETISVESVIVLNVKGCLFLLLLLFLLLPLLLFLLILILFFFFFLRPHCNSSHPPPSHLSPLLSLCTPTILPSFPYTYHVHFLTPISSRSPDTYAPTLSRLSRPPSSIPPLKVHLTPIFSHAHHTPLTTPHLFQLATLTSSFRISPAVTTQDNIIFHPLFASLPTAPFPLALPLPRNQEHKSQGKSN